MPHNISKSPKMKKEKEKEKDKNINRGNGRDIQGIHNTKITHSPTLWEVLEFIKADKPWTPSCALPHLSHSDSHSDADSQAIQKKYVEQIAHKVMDAFPINAKTAKKLYDEYSQKLLQVEETIMKKTRVGTNSGDMDGFYTHNSQYNRKALILLGTVVHFQHFKEFLLSFGAAYFRSIMRYPSREMPPKCWGAFELDHIKNDGIMVYKPKMTTWPFATILAMLIEITD